MPQELLERPPLRPLDAFGGSLASRVYASLKEAILDLSLRPGAILRKGEVCEALGVSRSPVPEAGRRRAGACGGGGEAGGRLGVSRSRVSEAVARLAAEALVEVVPQAGTFVARLS